MSQSDSILALFIALAVLLVPGHCHRVPDGSPLRLPRPPKIPWRCGGVQFVLNNTITFYGAPDNDPAWSNATAYDCNMGRNFAAAGDGSYENPLSFATADEEYEKCEVVYLPYVRKYLIHDDYCETCQKDWGNGVHHIDLWTGTSGSKLDGQRQIRCEEQLTPDQGQLVVRNPPKDLRVTTKPLWNGRKCNKRVHRGSKGREVRCPLARQL